MHTHKYCEGSVQTMTMRRSEVTWTLRAVRQILAPYLGERLDNVTLDLFTW